MQASIASAPGIAREHGFRERRGDQPIGQPLELRNAIDIGNVPDLAGLFSQGLDQVRMGVPQPRHGDAAAEIEISSAVGRHQPGTLAALEGEIDALVDRKQTGNDGVQHTRFACDIGGRPTFGQQVQWRGGMSVVNAGRANAKTSPAGPSLCRAGPMPGGSDRMPDRPPSTMALVLTSGMLFGCVDDR